MTKEETKINSKKVKEAFGRATKAGKRLKKIIIQLEKDKKKNDR